MNVEHILSFVLPDSFGDYLLYTAIFLIFTLMMIVLYFRNKIDSWNNEVSIPQYLLLFLVGIGTIVFLVKAWLSILPDGFSHYLEFAGVSFVFSLIPLANFFISSDSDNDETFIHSSLINGILFLFFLLWAFYSVRKAWLAIPPDGFFHYLLFAAGFIVVAVLYLIVVKFIFKDEGSEIPFVGHLINGFLLLLPVTSAFFCLDRAWSVIPPEIYIGLLLTVAGFIYLIMQTNDQH